jgi:hypothetical protein
MPFARRDDTLLAEQGCSLLKRLGHPESEQVRGRGRRDLPDGLPISPAAGAYGSGVSPVRLAVPSALLPVQRRQAVLAAGLSGTAGIRRHPPARGARSCRNRYDT